MPYTDACQPAPADRSPPAGWTGEAVEHLRSPFVSHSSHFTSHTPAAPRLPLQLPPTLPNPSAPQSMYDVLKIIPANHNLEKINA